LEAGVLGFINLVKVMDIAQGFRLGAFWIQRIVLSPGMSPSDLS
jgi:hypothetical protein